MWSILTSFSPSPGALASGLQLETYAGPRRRLSCHIAHQGCCSPRVSRWETFPLLAPDRFGARLEWTRTDSTGGRDKMPSNEPPASTSARRGPNLFVAGGGLRGCSALAPGRRWTMFREGSGWRPVGDADAAASRFVMDYAKIRVHVGSTPTSYLFSVGRYVLADCW